MRKVIFPALAASLALFGNSVSMANPPAHPTEHPAPQPDGGHGDHHEGETKPQGH